MVHKDVSVVPWLADAWLIVVPVARPDGGEPLDGLHASIRRSLAETVGGYTAWPVSGGWLPDGSRTVVQDDGIAYLAYSRSDIGWLVDILLRDWLAASGHTELHALQLATGRLLVAAHNDIGEN